MRDRANEEIGDVRLPTALFPRVRKQLQARFDADILRTDFGGGATRTPEWRRNVNEMGEIPVLEENGLRLTQTAPILLKLAEQYGRVGGGTAGGEFGGGRLLFLDQHK